MSSGPSHLVQILLPKETGNGQPVGKEWFDGFLEELTDKFGGATSFLRAPGQGLWQSGGATEKDQHRCGRSDGGAPRPCFLAVPARTVGAGAFPG